ncbi:MAG: hypothetical protein RBS17_06900, partial [Coriobacteriia bacterium]|nr:hypothetical protein [Coriobacteriia bacterium]
MKRAISVFCRTVRACLLTVFAIFLLAAAHSSHAQIPVILDDVTVFARPGQTVESVVGEYGVLPVPKVRAARDGRVVGEQKDAALLVMRNGVQASLATAVSWG